MAGAAARHCCTAHLVLRQLRLACPAPPVTALDCIRVWVGEEVSLPVSQPTSGQALVKVSVRTARGRVQCQPDWAGWAVLAPDPVTVPLSQFAHSILSFLCVKDFKF